MRRLRTALTGSLLATFLTVGITLAAKPDFVIVDISTPEYEADLEAGLLEHCGYPIEFDGSGHIIRHVFNDHPRLIEIDNYRLFETFSANGKTVTVRPDSGPDRIWVGADGAVYLALVGRSVTGSGVIGRTVYNLDTGELVSMHGHELGDFFAFLCEELAPPEA